LARLSSRAFASLTVRPLVTTAVGGRVPGYAIHSLTTFGYRNRNCLPSWSSVGSLAVRPTVEIYIRANRISFTHIPIVLAKISYGTYDIYSGVDPSHNAHPLRLLDVLLVRARLTQVLPPQMDVAINCLHTCRIDVVKRIISDVLVQIQAILVADRIRLKKSSNSWIITPCLVVSERNTSSERRLSGVAETSSAVADVRLTIG